MDYTHPRAVSAAQPKIFNVPYFCSRVLQLNVGQLHLDYLLVLACTRTTCGQFDPRPLALEKLTAKTRLWPITPCDDMRDNSQSFARCAPAASLPSRRLARARSSKRFSVSHQRSIASSRETQSSRRPERSRSASPMKRPSAASRSGVGEMMHPASCAAACSIKSSYSLTRHPHRVRFRVCRRADDEHAPATHSLLVDAVATQVNFVRHDPSLPLVIRADERRREKKRSDTELASTQTATLTVGSAQEWPLV
jgi:hypothetical protein